jgi:hypothetical protein
MKRLQLTVATMIMMLAISSSALAGNIAATAAPQQDSSLRGNIGAMLKGNIGALVGNIGATLAGNIGALYGGMK